MGATTFETIALGRDAGQAFATAREEAAYYHGHGGYTGTIAEKGSYVLFTIPAGVRCDSRRFLSLLDNMQDFDEVEWLRHELRYAKTATERKRLESKIATAEKRKRAFLDKLGPLARVVQEAAKVYDDKWGPAVAIELNGKEALEIKTRHGRKGTRDKVFLFCGWASC